MIAPIEVIFPASSMQYSLPSATSSVWSIMLAYLRSHEATCSTSPPRADLNFAVNARGAVLPTQAVCKKMLAAEADFPESARSVVFISSSYAVIAAPERGGVCDVQSDGRQTAKLFGIRLAPNGIAVYEVPPMTDVAQSRFDTLLVEGLTPSTAGAGPRMSDARSRPWPRVNFPSQRAPQFRSMVECTSTNTEPESRTRRTTKTINTVQRSPSTGRDQSNFGGDGDGKRHI
jgi:NAD(P)-dependent dehydrogenase (short-subunit alcohol dehydrogenase family)